MITMYWCELLFNGEWTTIVGLSDRNAAVDWQQRMEYGWCKYPWEYRVVDDNPGDNYWHCMPARVRKEIVEE